MEEYLVYLAYIYEGDYGKIMNGLKEPRPSSEQIRKVLNLLNCKYTTIISEDYPMMLKTIDCPPFVLFYYGNLELAYCPCMAMVGTRRPSIYGKQMALSFANVLSEQFVIVSGMAGGIDSYSHTGAKSCKTIAVLGSGIDYCYPKENMKLYEKIKNEGLLISEYPGSIQPKKYYFPWRNRIVAGLSLAVLVVESTRKSGTMITVGYALEQGKNVYAIPHNIGEYEGCNELIRDGAILINDPMQLELEDLELQWQRLNR